VDDVCESSTIIPFVQSYNLVQNNSPILSASCNIATAQPEISLIQSPLINNNQSGVFNIHNVNNEIGFNPAQSTTQYDNTQPILDICCNVNNEIGFNPAQSTTQCDNTQPILDIRSVNEIEFDQNKNNIHSKLEYRANNESIISRQLSIIPDDTINNSINNKCSDNSTNYLAGNFNLSDYITDRFKNQSFSNDHIMNVYREDIYATLHTGKYD